jgi:iron(III) transport system substrate-binding protein
MRYLVVVALLILGWLPNPGSAYEIEDRRSFGPASADTVLRVISTGDADLFAPILDTFLDNAPEVQIDYIVASSTELAKAITEDDTLDVAISSAMDLQTKLVNDGYALSHRSTATGALPEWATWRDHLFAFTQEPAAIVLSKAAFDGLPLPTSRQELIALMRSHPDRFDGKVGTYDVRSSGLGFLFATQDARTSETYWRLTEVMGGLGLKLYCCSGQMIDDVVSGKLAVAYNVLGSYALARSDDEIIVLLPGDFTTVMLRTAFITESTSSPEAAKAFVDHLVSRNWTSAPGLSAVFQGVDLASADQGLRRIRLGPGLLVFLDEYKKRAFFEEWRSAVLQ